MSGRGFVVVSLVVVCLVCALAGVFLGDVSGAWSALAAKIETDKLNAQAAAYDARAGLVVAEGEARILTEAARAVAADRRLVSLYVVSSNVAVLAGVLLAGALAGGLLAGVLLGRRGSREEVRRVG